MQRRPVRALASLTLSTALTLAACGSDESSSVTSGPGGSSGTSGAPTSGSSGSSTSPLTGEPKQGIATYYDYSGSSGVACGYGITADTGVAAYEFKDGSSQYWTAIQVRNHRLPIAKLEYEKNGTFTDMPRAEYNYFIDKRGVGVQPGGITLRVTAEGGQVLIDKIPDVQAGKVVDGSVQFK